MARAGGRTLRDVQRETRRRGALGHALLELAEQRERLRHALVRKRVEVDAFELEQVLDVLHASWVAVDERVVRLDRLVRASELREQTRC